MRDEPWRDPARPAAERVADLVGRMTLREKLAQLYGVWLGQSSSDGEDDVAPFQHDLVDDDLNWLELIKNGLGQLTRPFGSAPIEPAAGAARLAQLQAEITAAGRFGIPAIAHEECLTGFMTHCATVYPTPLAWGAAWSPDLVEEMAATIGASMYAVGIHQGLAPVLDVTRDVRWGRTEETIGEDPHLVATIGTAYVRGLRSAGIMTTLKHFVGYSASRDARNFGPVAIGPRELADVLLPPFLAAVRAGAESVMHSYADVDGVPPAANRALLTELLREKWGFDGTVVSDYFGVTFLETQHKLAANQGHAAGIALAAGLDVELPNVRCYGTPLLDAVLAGDVPESDVDIALTRVLRQKCELGLLDPGWESPQPSAVDFDPPAARALARRLAEESVVLLSNDGVLPLRPGVRVALVGAQADTASAMLGCYTFPQHIPSAKGGVAIPTLRESLDVTYAEGGDEAVAAARDADVCVVAVGDTSGLFGRGTSGEGTDAANLVLPGADLLDAMLATGTPVVLVLLTGRPYALGAYQDRCAAIVQAFFPGEEGGPAVAGVLTGRVSPSGRLPVSVPADPHMTPTSYLTPPLGRLNDASSVDPTPAFPFGHGLSYTKFDWSGFEGDGMNVAVTVTNTGPVAGAEVVQLYLHDPVAQVVRPVVKLLGYAKVRLAPGESRRVSFTVPPEATAFTGLSGRRIVEPGEVELRLAASAADVRQTFAATISGPVREIGPSEERDVSITVR
ncbi:glycoside hydrolase family 3 N-terminal domain-containing protein [Actinophytocola sp.]|uniref:glycoside hydrolase family 3 N-terminal domain-containing protein n=1 Tax=Actinophytocola sp. TaxID=1872138 RepID=UPI002D289E24|nr:glycoside hydrolase family 3 N-terminal domain-containing protein [Actinophytocola sp.]HYQ67109.1 glycoside hydrolase family 3 N-terminal domain-containing protein [Actinophytocola sp.]